MFEAVSERLKSVFLDCDELMQASESADSETFDYICGRAASSLWQIASDIRRCPEPEYKTLRKCVLSCLASLRRVERLFREDRELSIHKLRFELLPLVQGAYTAFYLDGYVYKTPERRKAFLAGSDEMLKLCVNHYIEEAERNGRYRYDVSVCVVSYNKLSYTRQCVESILKNIPGDWRYELILINHGSSDGTKEYFEEISPDKQIDVAVNGGYGPLVNLFEGQFLLAVCNDVVVLPGALENMMACMTSDPRIAFVVPATSNMSNYQTLEADYHGAEEMDAFARKNNVLDCFRWEQRVRLCNPICLLRSSTVLSTKGVFWLADVMPPEHSFPDDRLSLLLRRNGYRMMLAKDAYCHHYGSVTLDDEKWAKNKAAYYQRGRKAFLAQYGVDPWGIGFCYDKLLLDRFVGSHSGHTEVLGVSCGLGSNPLRIKEQIKEFCHNTDCRLTCLTDEKRFLADIKGISDDARFVANSKEFNEAIRGRLYDYIVWEDPFLQKREKADSMRDILLSHLKPDGALLVKRNPQTERLGDKAGCLSEIRDDWTIYRVVNG